MAAAKLKEAAAGRSAPSISDFKLEKRFCVTGGPDRWGYLMNGPSWWLMVKGEQSGGKLCHTMSISGCLLLMHSDLRGEKCGLTTLDMTILLFVGCELTSLWLLLKLLSHDSRRGKIQSCDHCSFQTNILVRICVLSRQHRSCIQTSSTTCMKQCSR